MATPCPERTQINSSTVTSAQIQALAQRDEQLNERICELERKIAGGAVLPGTFGFVSDAGNKSAEQTLVFEALDRFGAQGHFFGGDNNMTAGLEATIDENWEAFNDFIECGVAFPAFGNVDLDAGTPVGKPQMDKFNIPRYYDVEFDRGDVHLFVLNSGMNTARDLVEPDGITVGSTQWDWFISKLETSTRRWKIVMFHHPFVTSLHPSEGKKHVNVMDWGFHDLGVHLVLNGQIRANEHIRKFGLDILNVSMSGVYPSRNLDPSGTLQGETTGCDLVWADRTDAGLRSEASIAKIVAERDRMTVQVIRIADPTQVEHSFTIA